MWLFMQTCYVLSAMTFLMLLAALGQTIVPFTIANANHMAFMILISIVYCLTETLVIFFFVGTGVSVKEYTHEHKLDHSFHQRSMAIKHRVYPPLMLNLLCMIVLFILVGAVDTHRMPLWLYQVIFVGCLFHYVKVKLVQHACFRDNTRIILDMSGIPCTS